MRMPNPSPALDNYLALIGPEILSSTGAGVWRMAPGVGNFPTRLGIVVWQTVLWEGVGRLTWPNRFTAYEWCFERKIHGKP